VSNPKTSKLAAALNYLQQIANVRGEATPDDYQQIRGLQGDVTPSISTVTQAARDFGGGVATNLGNRARDIAPIIMETVDPRPLQARPATMKMLGDVASIGKAIVTDPIGTGKSIVSGEAERAKLAMNNPRSMGEYTGSFIDPLRIASALSKRPSIAELDVYHGTPHRFPPTENNPLGEFDASKIGTGEGAQAYGYGVYLAEAPQVAEGYKNSLQTTDTLLNGKKIWPKEPNFQAAVSIAANGYDTALAMARQSATAKYLTAEGRTHYADLAKKIEALNRTKIENAPSGSLYKADLPDEQIAKMLDYDKPFNQQLPNIQKAIKDALEIRKRQTGGYGLFDPLEKSSVEDLVKTIGEERLQQAGISGIKYLDEGSRGTNKGTRNFVVFPGEEKKIRILERK